MRRETIPRIYFQYNTQCTYRYTPLHLAASRGDVDCVRALLNQNADINAIDEFGKTPIRTAELIGKQTVVKVLKSEGVCIHINCQ